MMKISDCTPGDKFYTQLSMRVLAVLSIREDGWCVYVDAVPGYSHDREWIAVANEGQKQREPVARAIVENLFHPGFEVDRPYAL